MTITPEMKRAVAEANGSPLHLEDPETGAVYLVTRLGPVTRPELSAAGDDAGPNEFELSKKVPEGIAAAWAAFRRDRPAMLADKKLAGKVVLYHRDKRIAVGKRKYQLHRLAIERGIPHGEFLAFYVEPDDEDMEFLDP